MPDYIIRQRDRGEAEAKASISRLKPRPKFWPRGLNITGVKCFRLEVAKCLTETRQ